VIKLHVGYRLTLVCAEAFNVFEQEDGYVWGVLGLDAVEVRVFHILKYECRAQVLGQEADLDIIQFDSLDVPDEESVGWDFAEHTGFGILALILGRLEVGLCLCTSALIEDSDVV